jgi:hypothetical protein
MKYYFESDLEMNQVAALSDHENSIVILAPCEPLPTCETCPSMELNYPCEKLMCRITYHEVDKNHFCARHPKFKSEVK